MTPFSSRRPHLLFLHLLLLLLLPRPAAAEPEPEAACGDSALFRPGRENFVLDAEDAVAEGAALLATAHVRDAGACQRACCEEARCNLALLEPPPEVGNVTCALFNCVHRNRFVCRFVTQVGYRSFIRESVFRKHLRGPQGGEGAQAPPIAIAGHDVVVQPGTTVTLDGIESRPLGDAHIVDYKWARVSGDDGVRLEETQYSDQVALSNLQPGRYVFQLTVTDSNGQSQAAKVKVLVLSPELTALYCQAPPKVGPCRASFARWHYDAPSGRCQLFIFGGCKGNDNNFLSKEACEAACSGVAAPTERSVALPAKEECGSASCPASQLSCDSGCCLDRSLECDGVQQCSDGSDESHCRKLNQTFNRLLDIDINLKKARCSEPPHTGPCRASFSRWYYDPIDRRCSRFTYGGCESNGNNFEEESKCGHFCQGVTEKSVYFKGMFDRFESDDEGGDSGKIALAVLLAVAILALLAVLTYCFLRARKKRSHRPVATGPAHEALSDQDSTVYNSTTKPI